MPRQIKYVGPFLEVEAEGVRFTRHIFVTVSDATAEKLLKAKLPGEKDPAFVEKEPDPVAADAPAVEEQVPTPPATGSKPRRG